MKVFKFIWDIFKRFPLLLIFNALLLIMVSLLGAASLFTVSPIVDLFIHPDLQGVSPLTLKVVGILEVLNVPVNFQSWIILFAVFVGITTVLQVYARYFIIRTQFSVIQNIMVGTFKDFFNSQWGFFSANKQGTLLNSFTRELNIVGSAFGAIALFFADMVQMIIFLAVPLYISWQVTTISLGIAIVLAVPFIFLGKYAYRWGAQSTKASNHVSSVLQESFGSAKIIMGFGNQKRSIDMLSKAFDAYRKVDIKSHFLARSTAILYRPFGLIMVIMALFVAKKFNVPLSELAVLLMALLQVAVSMGNLITQKNAMESFFPSYQQIEGLRAQAQKLKQLEGGQSFKSFQKEITFKDVGYSYLTGTFSLDKINLEIQKGSMVALVGKSGSGKSTLVDLLMGFYKPLQGDILFDATALQKFDINSYRHRIGYVPQDNVLFHMSVKDNLLWAYPQASDSEMKEACQLAYADEFIEQLPEGYDTLVGDRGVRLSGGQIQRIALARAFLRKPELLILDEATSALDTHSERFIQKAIENISKETTVIVIAHRLSTIKKADCIYVLDNGRIIEQGAYGDLVRKTGHFNSMVQLQELGVSV